jgi:hypothetical protein
VDSGAILGNPSKTYPREIICGSRWRKDEVLYGIYVRDITAHTTLSGPNPFGAVSGGTLTLSCEHLLPIIYYEKSQRPVGDLGFCKKPGNWAIGHCSICTPLVFDSSTETKDILYFLLINSSNYDRSYVGEGLILQITSIIPGQYRRAGYLEMRDYVISVNTHESTYPVTRILAGRFGNEYPVSLRLYPEAAGYRWEDNIYN